ncbi:MAG: glycosyltransferase [Verrucomicrobia bacterium]|nr:glycosyltransferase [Verrucomicrobiota bacterium]
MRFTLIVMTLNEIDGMKVIMPSVDAGLFEQILVVDGGSTDGTVAWAREQGYDIVEQSRPGIRWGYIEALPHIRGDAVITFSPDGNSVVDLLPMLIAEMGKGYDMVIASRYLGDAKSEDDDILTAFGNWLFTTIINLLHGGHYTDAMVIYRAYRTAMIEELDLNKEESYTFVEKVFSTVISIEPLLSVRAAKRKLKIGEIPGDEPPRIGGERKLQIVRWGGAYMVQVFMEFFTWK